MRRVCFGWLQIRFLPTEGRRGRVRFPRFHLLVGGTCGAGFESPAATCYSVAHCDGGWKFCGTSDARSSAPGSFLTRADDAAIPLRACRAGARDHCLRVRAASVPRRTAAGRGLRRGPGGQFVPRVQRHAQVDSGIRPRRGASSLAARHGGRLQCDLLFREVAGGSHRSASRPAGGATGGAAPRSRIRREEHASIAAGGVWRARVSMRPTRPLIPTTPIRP